MNDMFNCVAPIYVYFGAQISSFLTSCFTTWTKHFEAQRTKIEVNPANGAAKPTLLKSNVAFRYYELRDATGGFHKKNLVGTGGFAKVYKAHLSDSRVVAVKKLAGKGKQSDREFRAEIETVGKVHHPNLVQLLGYSRTKDAKLLVYEFFENGSLNRYMRGSGKETLLDWHTRLKIALGAAKGIAYLHSCAPGIIHRDVKSSNILLDNHYEAKVSDFGLARFIDPSKTHVTTFLAGTKAYIAPEYQRSLRLTTKCDVYSYGIVLLELLTGKDPSFSGNFDLITWVKRRMSSRYEFFDVRMRDSGDKDSMTAVLNLALECTKTLPNQRPTMDEVVVRLSSLHKALVMEESFDEAESSDASGHGNNLRLQTIEESSDTATSSPVSVITDNDVFHEAGLEVAYERSHFPRVVSTPVLSEAAKRADEIRVVVTVEDLRESHIPPSEFIAAEASDTSEGTNGVAEEESPDSPLNKEYVRCHSF